MREKHNKWTYLLLLISLSLFAGCYRISPLDEDDLHNNPTTNNPNHIVDSNRGKMLPGVGM